MTTEMVNALLQWQRVISNQESKQLTKENKEIAKDKLIYWPENVIVPVGIISFKMRS